MDRTGLGESGDDFHVPPTGGTFGNVHPEHSPEQVSPGHTVTPLGGGELTIGGAVRFALLGPFVGARYDASAVGGI